MCCQATLSTTVCSACKAPQGGDLQPVVCCQAAEGSSLEPLEALQVGQQAIHLSRQHQQGQASDRCTSVTHFERSLQLCDTLASCQNLGLGAAALLGGHSDLHTLKAIIRNLC